MRRTASILIALVLILLALGIVIMASASQGKVSADAFYYFRRQCIWMAVALTSGIIIARIDYRFWKRIAGLLVVAGIILLCLVFVPGIGKEINGSHRWIEVGPLTIQPSELAKFAAVNMMAVWMAYVGRRAHHFKEGTLFPLMGLGVFLALILAEPDFGTTMLLGMVGIAIMFIGGSRITYLAIAGTVGLCAISIAIMQNANRAQRIFAFLFPEKFPDAAYHGLQSQNAFILGGIKGVGLGESLQKLNYLPEAHTDFIMAIIGEELGIWTMVVLLIYMGILICGIRISMHVADPYGRLLGFGHAFMIGLQACINIGVVTVVLPTKGITLPFISYGGSSLVMSVASVAILVNLAGHAAKPQKEKQPAIKNRAMRL